MVSIWIDGKMSAVTSIFHGYSITNFGICGTITIANNCFAERGHIALPSVWLAAKVCVCRRKINFERVEVLDNVESLGLQNRGQVRRSVSGEVMVRVLQT